MSNTHNKPVIMQIIPELGAGGAEQGCIDIAEAIIRADGVALVVSNGGYRVGEIERMGGIHIDMPVHSKNPLVMWQNISRLKRLIKKHKVDVVHARSRAPAWSAWRACVATSARFVTTCHAPYNISGEAKRLYNGSIANGEIVIAISEYVADYLKQNYNLPNEKIRLIHRGIPMERFRPASVTPERMIELASEWRIPDGSNIIMLPGRVTRWKGHHVLIDAMEKLNRDDVFCVMIGSDQGRTEYREELDAAITEKGLAEKMRIVDQCTDMPAAYMLSTVVVSASTDPEGFGRVPVEAQAMGRPIIATDNGGARETVVRNKTGWLVPPSDPDSLAAAIDEALAMNEDQRAILATRSMAHVHENFSKKIMAEKTLDVYVELLQQNKKQNTKEHQNQSVNAAE